MGTFPMSSSTSCTRLIRCGTRCKPSTTTITVYPNPVRRLKSRKYQVKMLKTSNRSTSRQKVANTHANRPTRNLSPDKTWTQSWIKGNSSSSSSSNRCPPFPKHHCTRTMPTRSVLRQTGNSHTIDRTCSTRRMGTIPTRKHQRHGLTIRHYSPPHPQQVVNPHNSQKNQNSARDHLTPCAVA